MPPVCWHVLNHLSVNTSCDVQWPSLCWVHRSAHPTRPGEKKDFSVHSLQACRRQARGLQRRLLHSQARLRVGRRHRVQRHVPGPSGREAGVEAIHRREAAHVFLCQQQVSFQYWTSGGNGTLIDSRPRHFNSMVLESTSIEDRNLVESLVSWKPRWPAGGDNPNIIVSNEEEEKRRCTLWLTTACLSDAGLCRLTILLVATDRLWRTSCASFQRFRKNTRVPMVMVFHH